MTIQKSSVIKCLTNIVQLYPDKIAIEAYPYSITYADFYALVQRISAKISVKHQQLGLLIEHNALMVASMFSSLATNNTYIPLDPTYPENRLSMISEDAQLAYILTDTTNLSLAKALAMRLHIPYINLDDSTEETRDYVNNATFDETIEEASRYFTKNEY